MTLIFFFWGGGEEVRWETVRTYGKILATPLLIFVLPAQNTHRIHRDVFITETLTVDFASTCYVCKTSAVHSNDFSNRQQLSQAENALLIFDYY